MKTNGGRVAEPGSWLGIEAGGTRTVAVVADGAGRLGQRLEAGPANLRLLSDDELDDHFRALARRLPPVCAVGIGMAGAREESDRRRIRAAAGRGVARVSCWAGNDLESAWAAAGDLGAMRMRVVVISGTGSCCYGRDLGGATVKVGGWGHVLGDRASGYDISVQALRTLIHEYDLHGRWPRLGERVLRAMTLNEPNELITWVQQASKAEVAALAVEVFAAWAARDRLATGVVAQAADTLARDAVACARRLAAPKHRVEFILVGGVLHQQPRLVHWVTRRIRSQWPRARVRLLEREGAWGAWAQARALDSDAPGRPRQGEVGSQARPTVRPGHGREGVPAELVLPEATALSPTEQRHPRSHDLDRRSLGSAVELMLSEDEGIPAALRAQRGPIVRALRLIVRALRGGGRLFYVGAGTSGRLGVLDASECPPTFRASPDQVQAIIAGGHRALWSSIEGAEDDGMAGAQAVSYRGVRAGDVVLGIAASGRTPFVWGALIEAQRQGATTLLLCFNPHLKLAEGTRPAVVIAPELGPEVLTGSTRLKAGTATKLVLNIFSTLAMVRLGKVLSNLMVDLNPANAKLRERAVRIVRELTAADAERARAALERSGWAVKAAVQYLRLPVRKDTATK